MSAQRATFAVPLRSASTGSSRAARATSTGDPSPLTSGANALRAALPTLPLGAGRRPAALGPAALRLVPSQRSSAARAPFVLLVVTLLVGGLLGLLLLNTLVAQGSFAVHDLATSNAALVQREQELAKQVEARQAPAALAVEAARLGMVESGPPAFLRLPSGAVVGAPQAGLAPPAPARPVVAPSTAAKPTTTKPTTTKPTTTKPAAAQGAHR